MNAAVQRFTCTQCGACCNRSPEVELSEAAALADVFVFRLMFRLYWLPRNLIDYSAPAGRSANASATFYQKKRLLTSYAARRSPAKIWRDGKAVQGTKYLTISALSLDTSRGSCGALDGTRCSIYERRPLACRTVPFHYARAEALAEHDLKAFVETPGYDCDTGETANVVLKDGRIVDPAMQQARSDALPVADRDRRWNQAIVRRMNADRSADSRLPSMAEIEANAALGATTTSMRVAWQVALEAGLMDLQECQTLVANQLALIDRELASGRAPDDAHETLADMQSEYRHALNNDQIRPFRIEA